MGAGRRADQRIPCVGQRYGSWLRLPAAATTQAPQLPPATRTRLSPRPLHEVSSHDQRPTRRGASTEPRRHCLQGKAPGCRVIPHAETAAFTRSDHNASAAVTDRDKSPAFTGSPPRGELTRPPTDTPRCTDHGRDVTVYQGKPARREQCDACGTGIATGFAHVAPPDPGANETAPRDCKQLTATRHRGDAPTSRTTEPVSRSCRALGMTDRSRARTPRGPRQTRKIISAPRGFPRTYRRPRHPRRGERQLLRTRPRGPALRKKHPPFGEHPSPSNKTLRPRLQAT